MKYLNLLGIACPLNFVKIKLRLEEMPSKEILRVYLDDGEPIRMVPDSLRHEGHEVVSEKWLDVPTNLETMNIKNGITNIFSKEEIAQLKQQKITSPCWQVDVMNN